MYSGQIRTWGLPPFPAPSPGLHCHLRGAGRHASHSTTPTPHAHAHIWASDAKWTFLFFHSLSTCWVGLCPRSDRLRTLGLQPPQFYYTHRAKILHLEEPAKKPGATQCRLVHKACHSERSRLLCLLQTPVQWRRVPAQEKMQALMTQSSIMLPEDSDFTWDSVGRSSCLRKQSRTTEVLVASN